MKYARLPNIQMHKKIESLWNYSLKISVFVNYKSIDISLAHIHQQQQRKKALILKGIFPVNYRL